MVKQTNNSKQRFQNAQSGQSAGSKQSSQNAGNRPDVQAQGKRPTGRAAQRATKQQQRQQELHFARRSRLITIFSILGAVVIGVVAIVSVIFYDQSHPQTQTAVNPSYPAVDNISCDTLEQSVYHIHAHVSIYINGSLNQIPQNVGIAGDGSCYYWLHTHDSSGVIHIESPTQKDYPLGSFFDEWSQRFSSLGYPSTLDVTTGWQIWINGKPYTGNFRTIPLTAHELITMAYNSPGVKPDTSYSWNGL
jgi:hypothetical protein